MKNKQPWLDWILASLREAAWAPLSVVGFYAFGLAFRLFKMFPFIDIPTHFMGGVAITYFYRVAIQNSQKFLGDIPAPIQILLAFTATGTTTVLWELYENLERALIGLRALPDAARWLGGAGGVHSTADLSRRPVPYWREQLN